MASYTDPLSYITVIIAAHGNDSPTQKLNPFVGVKIRKLTMVGQSGTCYMAMEGFQQQIIEIFKRVKTENSGMRFDHMLERFRDELRKSSMPRGLTLYDTFVQGLVVEEMKRTGNTSSGYILTAPAKESEWVQYTSAQYEHNYDFTDPTGNDNHGIWIVDSSSIPLSQMKPKDIYCSYTKFQGKSWQTGESILNGSEMYFGGQQPTQIIQISELARRLSEKYHVANVNFIDLSCRSLSPSDFAHLSDATPSFLVTATPRTDGAFNTKPVIGIEQPRTQPLPLGWTEQKDQAGNTFYQNLAGRTSYSFPTDLDYKNPMRGPDIIYPTLPQTPSTQRATGVGSFSMAAQEVPVAHRSAFTQGQEGRQASQAPYQGSFGAQAYTHNQVPVAYRSDFTQGRQGRQASQRQPLTPDILASYENLDQLVEAIRDAGYTDEELDKALETWVRLQSSQRQPLTPAILASYENLDQLIEAIRDAGYTHEEFDKALETWERLHSRGGRFKKSRRQNSNRQNSNRQNSKRQNSNRQNSKKQNKKKW
jgi:uncharacterized protein Smg (DUF494 family)